MYQDGLFPAERLAKPQLFAPLSFFICLLCSSNSYNKHCLHRTDGKVGLNVSRKKHTEERYSVHTIWNANIFISSKIYLQDYHR
jgi:hypothetical protein